MRIFFWKLRNLLRCSLCRSGWTTLVIGVSLPANPIRFNPPPAANHTGPCIPCGAYSPIRSQTLFSHHSQLLPSHSFFPLGILGYLCVLAHILRGRTR